jgi:metal-dependent HD superfamily phosphatase/phosphodiesterase
MTKSQTTRMARKHAKAGEATSLTVTVTINKHGVHPSKEVAATGSREIRDPKLVGIIAEYLQSIADENIAHDQADEMVSNAIARSNAARDTLQQALKELDVAVVHDGLIYQPDDWFECYPAAPALTLVG